MITLTPSIVVDVFLALLLVIAIAYFWRLDVRLKALKSDRDGMLEATKELAQTIQQAESTIAGLKSNAAEAGSRLQLQIDEARALHKRGQENAGISSADAGLRRRTSF